MKKIDNALLESVLGLRIAEPIECDLVAPLFVRSGRMLSFLDDARFLAQLDHPSVVAVFMTKEIAAAPRPAHVTAIVCEEPRYCFATMHNHWTQACYVKEQSTIDPSAKVHPRAYVAEHNVRIGPGCVVEPNVTILPDVVLGAGCHIHAGAVLGADGFESQKTSRGLIVLFHDAKLILEEDVRIGANASLDKGIYGRSTIIGKNTTIGPLSYIAHGVQIGANSTVTGTAVICGSATIDDAVKVGPNSTVSHTLHLGRGAFVRLGSVVTKDVGEGESVSGNFAIPHQQFMVNLKRSLA